MVYRDRQQAGRIVAEWVRYLRAYDPVVVGVANGGVVVAREIAAALDAPLDSLVVRKLAAPRAPELTMGAVGEGAIFFSNHAAMRECPIKPEELAEAAHREHGEVVRQTAMLRHATPAIDLAGRVVVLVDDGISTGATIRVAVQVLRARGAGRVIVAIPIAPATVLDELRRSVDQVICPKATRRLHNLHSWYAVLPDVGTADVATVLREHADRAFSSTSQGDALPAQP